MFRLNYLMHISAVRSGNSTGMSYFHLALILTCEKKRENVEENVEHKIERKFLKLKLRFKHSLEFEI